VAGSPVRVGAATAAWAGTGQGRPRPAGGVFGRAHGLDEA